MRQFIKWARGSASKTNSTVGPRHDPYSRDTVTVTIDDRTVKFVTCGLAGDYLLDPSGYMVRADLRTKEEYRDACVHFTGQSHDFWMDRVWRLQDRARYRRDPAAYELQMQIEEAEDRAYGGYM